MDKALVFCSLAFGEEAGGSVNITCEEKRRDIYYENAFVSLVSVKADNPQITTGVITNKPVPPMYQKLFDDNEIMIWYAPFDQFVFPACYKWHLAFYKLTTLCWAVNNLSFEHFIQIDCDVVCNGSLSDLLEDLQYGIMMLSGPFTYHHDVRTLYRALFQKMYHRTAPMIKWGSGLIAGKASDMKVFMDSCLEVYHKMLETPADEMQLVGDEYITSAAAILSGLPIYDGKPYMHVYWTGRLYLTSTNYKYDKIVLLHMPVEKEIGMHTIYNYFLKHGRLPSKRKMYVYLSLPKARNPYVRSYIKAVCRKLKRLIK